MENEDNESNSEGNNEENSSSQEEVMRVRMPRGKELIGVIEESLGASRFKILCTDNKLRVCRMPGRFRRRMKISVGDIAIVVPWEVESDTRGDVVWIYTRTQANWLRKKGIIDM